MESIEALIKSLPNLSAMGWGGIVVFVAVFVAYIIYQIIAWKMSKPTDTQTHANNQQQVSEHHDTENPAANQALENDQTNIKDVLD